ncbi:sugar phosphate isomerase/epimerase [Paenibacillus sp. TRM 82003]|nr:sugar phosphate isomerase/epimerase [Paenibacillus sp. TRM 82003]
MKIGLSSYSLSQAIQAGELSILDTIDWVKEHGGEHIEIVPIGFDLEADPQLPEAIRERASAAGIDVSNYCVRADFLAAGPEAYEAEIERVRRHVDIAARLGAKRMRHDVAWRRDTSIGRFLADLPALADACRRIADYAARYEIVTSIENHGYYVQASDRVQAIVQAVDRPNFRTTLDVGNFLCADEDPVAATRNNIAFASMVHLKDFYVRRSPSDPGEGWFPTTAGSRLRGAILGHGDIDLAEIMRIIRDSGYDGCLSVEFEGLEECRYASRVSLDNARRLWAQSERSGTA